MDWLDGKGRPSTQSHESQLSLPRYRRHTWLEYMTHKESSDWLKSRDRRGTPESFAYLFPSSFNQKESQHSITIAKFTRDRCGKLETIAAKLCARSISLTISKSVYIT